MIRHASIYDPNAISGTDAGIRVLVMRYWPRGVKRERVDLWVKDAAPSRALLHAYQHDGVSWDEFERRYRAEMLDERSSALEQLRALEREHGEVILLCHERQGNCHRQVLQQLLVSPRSGR